MSDSLIFEFEKLELVFHETINRSVNDRDDKTIVLSAVRRGGKALRHASEELRNDREIVLAAVQRCGIALQHASKELRNDREIVLAAVQRAGSAFKYANKELRNDREIVLAAVQRAGSAFKYASKELRNDREIVLAAVHRAGSSLRYASEELRKDKDVVLAAVQKDDRAFEFASEELQCDLSIQKHCKVQQIPKSIEWHGIKTRVSQRVPRLAGKLKSNPRMLFEELHRCQRTWPEGWNEWHLKTTSFELFKTLDENSEEFMMLRYLPTVVENKLDTYYHARIRIQVASPTIDECWIVRDAYGLIWLLIVVPDKMWADVVRFIRSECPTLRFCVRESSYKDSNYELSVDVDVSSIHHDMSELLETYSFASSNDWIQAICYGASLDKNVKEKTIKWVGSKSLWVFSRFKGFVPVDFPVLPPGSHIFHADAPKSLATFEYTDFECELFGGLKIQTRDTREGDMHIRLSCGIKVCVTMKDEGEPLFGVLTTRHKLENGEDILYNKKKTVYDAPTLEHLGKVRYLVEHSIDICMDPDFAVVVFPTSEFDEASSAGNSTNMYNSNVKIDPLSVAHTWTLPFRKLPPKLKKSGGVTGVTEGTILSEAATFTSLFNHPPDYFGIEFDEPSPLVYRAKKNILGRYLLIYGVFQKLATFATFGDSGGLCWFQEEDGVVAVGLVVSVLTPGLFLVLPFQYIKHMCRLNDITIEFLTDSN